MDSVTGLLVEGIQFRNAANDAVSPDDCAELEFRRCSFRDIGDSGIQDFGTAGFLRVVKCSFLRCGWGLAISYSDGAGSEGIEVRDSTFKMMGSVGIEFSGNGALIVGNRISMEVPATGIGIKIRGNGDFTDAEISGNSITKAAVGIEVTGGGHTVQSCVLKGCTTGILVDGSGGNGILSNTVKKSVERGIEINNAGNEVIGNVVKGSGEWDIGGSATQSSNTLEGNTFGTSGFAPET
jgi:parallel beta-helix repeat protein